jgi:hypothetical protein
MSEPNQNSIIESRFELFKAALLVDEQMLLRHAVEYYQLTLPQLSARGIGVFDIEFPSNRRCYKMKVVSLKEPDHDGLVHRLGTAMMRLTLGADVRDWSPVVALGDVNPDAVWISSEGRIGIEFDAGNYSKNRVYGKAQQLAILYHKQVWGTFGSSRVATLERYLSDAGVDDFEVVQLELP